MKPIVICVRSIFLCALLPALLLALLWPAQALGEVIEFVIDPTRSTVQVEPGSELSLNFGMPLNSVTMPAMAPTIGIGGILPDGSTSDGLVTSLKGTILADLDDGLASIRIIGRRTSIRFGDSGSWLPGPPGAETTPTAGKIAVEFNAASILFVGNAVLREATFSLDSGNVATPLTLTATDVYSFPAGCAAPPCPSFRLEDGVGDLETMFTSPLRDGLRSHYIYTSPAGTTGTLERLPDQRYQLTIPFDLATTLAPEGIRAAIPSTIGLAYSGTIVAVPEPDSVALSLAAVAALLGLLAWKIREKRGLAVWLVAGAIGMGCDGTPKPDIGTTSLQGSTTCSDQLLRTSKNNGAQLIFEKMDPFCNLFGFFGTIGPEMSGWNLYPYANFSSNNAFDRYVVAGVNLVAAETFSTNFEIHQELRYRATYGVVQEPAGSVAEMYVRARPFTLGVDYQLFGGATISLDYGLGTDQFGADDTFRYYPLDPLGGMIQMDVSVDSERVTVGQGYQGVGISFGIRGQACSSNHQCKNWNPALPYCGPVGCHAGGNGEMCEHDVQCNGPLGHRCSSWQTCAQGNVGDACQPREGDCKDGHSCDQILLTCQIIF